MGGKSIQAPINEAVFLLKIMAPEALTGLRSRYPNLSDELQEGVFAGEEESDGSKNAYLIQRARVVTTALEEAAKQTENAMLTAANLIRGARNRRLISQVLVLVGSSSLLGAVALEARHEVMVISSLLTLLAALGNLFAEHYERLLNPKVGNIYDAFQKLGEGSYKARRLTSELQLAMSHEDGINNLAELVGTANQLCEELNGWLIQTLNQFTRVPITKV